MSRPRAKRPIRNPFVVTLAAATAIFAPACGARVDSVPSDAGTGSDTQPIDCPTTQPAHGARCSGDVTCTYPDYCGPISGGTTAICEKGEWRVMVSTCNPPPPDCPLSEPKSGDPCWSSSGMSCSYPDRCMPGNYGLFACSGGTWRRTSPPIAAACPTTPPMHGSSCAECAGRYPSSCVYEWCDSAPSRESVCDPVTKTWDSRWLSCNPPPPMDAGPGPEDPDAAAPDPGAP